MMYLENIRVRIALVVSFVWPLVIVFANEPWKSNYYYSSSSNSTSIIFWVGFFPIIIFWSWVFVTKGRVFHLQEGGSVDDQENKTKNHADGENKHTYDDVASLEIKAKRVKKDIWNRSLELANGDKDKAVKHYIVIRSKELKEINRQGRKTDIKNDRKAGSFADFGYSNLGAWRKVYLWINWAAIPIVFLIAAGEREPLIWIIAFAVVPYTLWLHVAVTKRKVIQLWILAALSVFPLMAPVAAIIVGGIAYVSKKETDEAKSLA